MVRQWVTPNPDAPANETEAESVQGRWRNVIANADINAERRAQLEALGYVGATQEAPPAKGVTVHDPSLAHEGLNLFTSGHAGKAYLMTMDGDIVHQWARDFNEIWPDRTWNPQSPYNDYWGRVHLDRDGNIIALYEKAGIFKLDKNSNVLWANDCSAHHDIAVLPDGRILTLTTELHDFPESDKGDQIQEEFVTVLGADGAIIERHSLLEMLANSPYAPALRYHESGDILHTNTLELLPDWADDHGPVFAEGRLLTCFRNLDLISVIDMKSWKLVWALGGMWRWPHQPTLLRNGNILIYDNLGLDGDSRVFEFDPYTQAVHWTFGNQPGQRLDSPTHGAATRLPNGNTLITESDKGHAIEITEAGEVAWKFYSPHRAGEHDELVPTIPEMVRIPYEYVSGWLDE